MTEQTAQRPSPEGSVLVHELNHRVNNEVAAAIGVAFLAATRSGNDKLSAMDRRAGFDPLVDMQYQPIQLNPYQAAPEAMKPLALENYVQEKGSTIP
jgi:hypothetical protein